MPPASARARDPLLDRLLSILAERDPGSATSPGEWHALLTAAGHHSVQPLFALRLLASALPLPLEVAGELRRLQEETAHRNMRRMRDFSLTVTALQQRGIAVIALKGIPLLSSIYGSLSARAMVDLDLLVRPCDLQAAGHVMREVGYEPLSDYRVSEDDIPFYAHHLPSFLKPGFSTVELHWHIASPRATVSIDVNELWQRSTVTRLAGVETRVLAVEDLLLHLIIHATYSHRCDELLRACCDVTEIIRRQVISWDAVVERARRWKAEAGTYLILRLISEEFSVAIPDHVLHELQPRDFDEVMLDIALRADFEGSHARRLRHARGPREKLKLLRKMLMINPDDLADSYNVPRSSPLVFGLYVARAAGMAKRWREVAAAYRGRAEDAAETDALERYLGMHSE
jgi:hypothetical protein